MDKLIWLILGAFIILIYRQFFLPKRIFKYEWMQTHFAHRGLYTKDQLIPENSMEGFKQAISHGYGIELDLTLTKDNQFVVFHDDDLKRMCFLDLKVKDINCSDLTKYYLANSLEKIPCFKDVLACVNGQVPLMIEIKSTSLRKESISILKKYLEVYQGPYCVVSFDPLILNEVKKQMPYVLRGQIVQNFMKEKRYSFFKNILLSYACLNFMTRPDFLSYHYADLNFTYKVNQFLKGFGSIWPISSQETENIFQNRANLIIFESYRPHEF